MAIAGALGGAPLLALVVGGIALRVGGIAFAMVTLAFAQAASIIILRNPGGVTGGDEGRTIDRAVMPDLLVGVADAPYRYWLALGFHVAAWLVVTVLVRSRAEHAKAAVRENEARACGAGGLGPPRAPRRAPGPPRPRRLAALAVPAQVRTTAVDTNHDDIVLGTTGVAAVVDAVDRLLVEAP